MKRLRIIALASVTFVILAFIVYGSKRRPVFETPTDCLDAYREAIVTGEVKQYEKCLAEPLRAKIQRQHSNAHALAEALRTDAQEIKSWIQRDALATAAATVQVDVDEVRPSGNRRIRFQLQRFDAGWLIVGIDQPKFVPAGIPYGTHVSKVPEEPQPASQP